jgi:hypothetical protein
MGPRNNILCVITTVCLLCSAYCGSARADDDSYAEKQITYSLMQGWNMVSFPFGIVTQIENDGHICNTFFHYNPSTVSYDFAFANIPGSIDIGYGYFVYADADTTIPVTGVPSSNEQETVELKAGFNCFGSPYDSPDRLWGLNQVVYEGHAYSVYRAIENGWLDPTLFWYNPESASYDFYYYWDSLEPGKGYVLYSAVDCTLVFDRSRTAGVIGAVYDCQTTEPLQGITVSIGTIQDTTDSRGVYLLLNVPVGTQEIVSSGRAYDTYTDTVYVSSGTLVSKSFSITPVASVYGIVPE